MTATSTDKTIEEQIKELLEEEEQSDEGENKNNDKGTPTKPEDKKLYNEDGECIAEESEYEVYDKDMVIKDENYG